MINEMNGIDESGTWHDAIARFTEVPVSSAEATRPNIFRIAGFPRRETVSSNVLAYFFDPAEDHCLKDMMLKALLRTIHKEDMDVSDVSVSTEVSTDKNNRIDILLDLPELSIVIENKVDSGLNNDLADYRSWAAKHSGNEAIVVVLHPFPFDNFALADHPSAQGLVVEQDLFDVLYDDLFRNALGMLGEYSLDANPRAVDLLQQFIDNYSPERKQKKMNNTSTDIVQFVSQANGIEQQLVNVRKSFENYTEAVHSKLQTIHKDLISQWTEESPVNGKSVTLANNWEWPTPKRHKPFDNQYYAQSFKLENPGSGDMGRVITCEFFLNIEFNDGYVSSDPEYGSFNTIWYKAYWGGYGTKQKPEVRITKPYHQILDVKLEDSNEDIKNAVEAAVERTLKTCWNI
ncbi:PD-(D/E)XK nuclease family protein [Bifidobacterium thermophilum]|uniref:PD-(D/E)XK nuclease family protein n=1 Tax=Bifidobacterium thermophilum TaxID=33905 RepID=UPI003F910F3B